MNEVLITAIHQAFKHDGRVTGAEVSVHKFVVVTSSGHIVDGAQTQEAANALKATWFRNFPDVCFSVKPAQAQR